MNKLQAYTFTAREMSGIYCLFSPSFVCPQEKKNGSLHFSAVFINEISTCVGLDRFFPHLLFSDTLNHHVSLHGSEQAVQRCMWKSSIQPQAAATGCEFINKIGQSKT